jgi:pyroglutamyl-peptidase
MARTAKRLGEEAAVSHDAGGYVCNHAFFTAAHLGATSASGMRVGFVHLPPVARDDVRLLRIVEVVRAWLTERSA